MLFQKTSVRRNIGPMPRERPFGQKKGSEMKKYELIYTPERGEILETTAQGTVLLCPPEGLSLVLELPTAWQDGDIKYITVEAEGLGRNSVAFDLCLWEDDPDKRDFDMRIMFGILPGVLTPVPISLSLLDSQRLFPSRTKGVLKLGVFGKPVVRENVRRITLTTTPTDGEQKLLLRRVYLSDEEPQITFDTKPLTDELGQWALDDWKGKTNGREECTRDLRQMAEGAKNVSFDAPDRDRFGGYTKLTFEKTGRFRAEKRDGRWWLVTPDGNAFISAGVDCMCPGIDARIDVVRDFVGPLPEGEDFAETRSSRRGTENVNFGVANLIHAFGRDGWREKWEDISRAYLVRHGFNTVGNWSDGRFIKSARLPYVLPLGGFPWTEKRIFRDFPDVFSPEYEENAKKFASQLEEYKDDEYMIGYFLRNEPEWAFVYGLSIAEELLASREKLVSKDVLINALKEKYGTPEALSAAWKREFKSFDELYTPIFRAASLSEAAKADLSDFSERMIYRYVSLPSIECKKVDSGHMNLGMRYAYISDKSLVAGYEHFDVFSLNCYQYSPYRDADSVGRLLDKPVMIGEFHHGALDRGLSATGIRGVKTQEDRGIAYRYYMEQGLKSPYFVGAHYFQYNDQNCLGRFDGENYQIGMVDVCMKEYPEIAAYAEECHRNMYAVALGEKAAFDQKPHIIPAIHY